MFFYSYSIRLFCCKVTKKFKSNYNLKNIKEKRYDNIASITAALEQMQSLTN